MSSNKISKKKKKRMNKVKKDIKKSKRINY